MQQLFPTIASRFYFNVMNFYYFIESPFFLMHFEMCMAIFCLCFFQIVSVIMHSDCYFWYFTLPFAVMVVLHEFLMSQNFFYIHTFNWKFSGIKWTSFVPESETFVLRSSVGIRLGISLIYLSISLWNCRHLSIMIGCSANEYRNKLTIKKIFCSFRIRVLITLIIQI